ncbi:helix-turn-helix domain-containing protein [Streptomyces sp. BI20]|uniref:helix-turn-helix domain-containing protein n=1 Tax=Streptomyces sp. BI20 TaxID=3403460 RepID=UPI003C73B1FE
MTLEPPTRRVLDPARDADAVKALTHPLRIRLLGLLRQNGPATASELAVATGESSASTSYHLRVLARHGFVVEAEHRDARERRWRSVHELTSWDDAQMTDGPGGRAFLDVMQRAQVEHLERSLGRHAADLREGALDPAWAGAAGVGDWLVRLTPESLAELWEHLEAKVLELRARDAADPRARDVAVLMAGLPFADRSGADGANGANGTGGTGGDARSGGTA